MAQQNLNGLFQGASTGDIARLIGLENDARANQAYANTRGPVTAQVAARNRERDVQGWRSIGQLAANAADVGFGLGGKLSSAVEDPRLGKARKREVDKQEIMQMLGEFNNDGVITQEEYKKGQDLLMSKGYHNEAKKWADMAGVIAKQSLDKRTVEQGDRGLDIKQDSVAFDIEYRTHDMSFKDKNLHLDELMKRHGRKLDWAKFGLSEKDYGLKKDIFLADRAFKDRTFGWQQKMDSVNTVLKERGLAINEEGNLIQRIGVEGNLNLGQQKVDLSKLDLSLRKSIQDAQVAYRNKTFGWQQKMDVINNTLKDRGLDIRVEGNKIARLTAESNIELGEKNYNLKQQEQLFTQDLQTNQQGINKMLADHKVFVGGERLALDTLTQEQRYNVALQQYELNKKLGLGGLDLRKDDLKMRRWAKQHDIKLRGSAQKFNEESFAKNQELLRDRFSFDKDKFSSTMDETAKQRIVNMELAERRIELQERGIDLETLSASHRMNLASEMFAEEKLMNIHKMDHQEKQLHLTEQLAKYSNHWKGREDELARMSLTQKKELFKEQMKHETKLKNLEGQYKIGAAKVKAGAGTPTEVKAVTENDLLEMTSFLKNNPNIEKKLGGGFISWLGDDTDKISSLSSKYKAWKGKNKGRGLTDFFNQGTSSSTTGDAFSHAKKGPNG